MIEDQEIAAAVVRQAVDNLRLWTIFRQILTAGQLATFSKHLQQRVMIAEQAWRNLRGKQEWTEFLTGMDLEEKSS